MNPSKPSASNPPGDTTDLPQLSPALSKLPRFSFTGEHPPSSEVASQAHGLAYGVRSPKILLTEADLRFPNAGAQRSAR